MNEKEVMNLLNSIDDDLVDKKIDDLLSEKGESINMNKIKEQAMKKIDSKQNKKFTFNKKIVAAAAVMLTLTVTTVYAKDISQAIKSFFNKSVVYTTVVDGDAYYLPEKIKLNEKFTLSHVSVSKGKLDMAIISSEKLGDKKTEELNLLVTPMNDKNIRYSVGGYGGVDPDGIMTFSFMNETEGNYNIAPFKDFILTINGQNYDVSLAKAESLKTDEDLVLGDHDQANPLIANVAGSTSVNKGLTNIQLVAGFDNPDLKLVDLKSPQSIESSQTFENKKDGILTVGGAFETKPIIACDKNNTEYTLKEPKDAVGRPITVFETKAKQGTELTVKLPAILAGFEKEVAKIDLSIPKKGKISINKEIDFIIQKANLKSIERVSKDTALIELELNTGDDKTVSIVDIGAYSKDVLKGEISIKGNTAIIKVNLEKDIDNANFTFSWPKYVVRGNWSIDLVAAK